jgi:ABC-type dipeptide/oligopeptide/nickel transport system permease subunit
MSTEVVTREAVEAKSTRSLGLYRWVNRRKTFTFGILITVIFVGASIFAPIIAPYPPGKTNYDTRFADPSWEHLMGTDAHGRDIFSRVLHGGQVSLYVSFVAVAASALIGIPIGLTAGFFGGVYDTVVSRIVDALFAFPGILWAISIVTILGPSASSAMIALAIGRIPLSIRIARSTVISAKENEYVAASRALGSSWHFIIFRSILPNCAGPIIVMISLGFAVTILAEAGLSYLGLSVQPPTPSWGNLLQESQRYLYESVWFALFPGLTLFLVVLGLNLVGDGVRDMFDPRNKQRK